MDARDDLIINDQYSLDAHHSEEAGKKIRRKIWIVTIILTLITAVEIGMGIQFKRHDDIWEVIKWSFILMTLVKAGYIVLVFMHLGDEQKNLKWTILGPYLLFMAYLLFISLTEANYVYDMLVKYI